jgi:transcription antitermination factor NusG
VGCVSGAKTSESAYSTSQPTPDRSHCDPKWYAVFTMPRHEKRVAGQCSERNVEAFLPLYQVRHRWKNRRIAAVDLPLFPNYFFVRIEAQERLRVLKLPGVLSIVSSGRQLLPVPEGYISALRSGLLARRLEPHPNVEAGDRVCITTGPMAGMEGILDRQKNELRVVVRLEMIGRSVAVEVGAEEVSYVGAAPKNSPVSAWHELAKPTTADLCY